MHPEQGSQFSSYDWQDFPKAHNLQASMNLRESYDNAVAENFYQLLKRERIRRRIYSTTEEARLDVVDYIEMFYVLQEAPLGITRNVDMVTTIGYRR